MNIYVGNLSYNVTREDLEELFAEYGEVTSVKVIMDRETGRSKGFGFVEMTDDAAGQQAIENLDGNLYQERNLKVNQAKPREPRERRGGFRNRY